MHKKLQAIEKSLNNIFVEREKEIHGLTLAVLSNNNVLYLGPPGTAKSDMAEMWTQHIKDANFFSWLLSEMTKDTEVVGAPDINTLVEEGKEVRNTQGKLPEAHIAVLDEIWKSSSALANHLLKVLNEREFDNGDGTKEIPLLSVVGLSNELPDEESNLEAALDRFVLKYDVKPVREAANVIRMMKTHLKRVREGVEGFDLPEITLDELHDVREAVNQVNVGNDIMTTLYKIQEELYSESIYPSARTINACLQIMQAEAYYHGRDTVVDEDMAVLVDCLWEHPDEYKPVYTTVMGNISPEEPKILELFQDCEEIYEGIASETDEAKQVEVALEVVNKLKEAKRKMQKHRKSLKEKGKNTSEADKLISKVQDMMKSTYEEHIGVEFN